MTDAAAIAATFADWRPVKSRKVLQLVLEVPVEQTEAVLKALGAPMPDKETWVAVALMDMSKAKSSGEDKPKPRRPVHTLPRSQQAGILCNSPDFQKWVGLAPDHPAASEEAAEYVRDICGVASRAHLDTPGNSRAAERFDALLTEYEQATGRCAEDRA